MGKIISVELSTELLNRRNFDLIMKSRRIACTWNATWGLLGMKRAEPFTSKNPSRNYGSFVRDLGPPPLALLIPMTAQRRRRPSLLSVRATLSAEGEKTCFSGCARKPSLFNQESQRENTYTRMSVVRSLWRCTSWHLCPNTLSNLCTTLYVQVSLVIITIEPLLWMCT